MGTHDLYFGRDRYPPNRQAGILVLPDATTGALLEQLRSTDAEIAWQEFLASYSELIFGVGEHLPEIQTGRAIASCTFVKSWPRESSRGNPVKIGLLDFHAWRSEWVVF